MPRKKTTRAAAGAGSIRKRPNGKWEARYTVGTDPATGKPIRKSVYGDTQSVVRQKMTQALAEIDNGDYLEPTKLTFAEYLNDIWLADCMGNKKYSTIKSYRALVKNHIIPVLGNKKLSDITPYDIQKFCNLLAIDGHKVAKLDTQGHIVKENGETVYDTMPLSAKTIKNIHGVLTKAFTDAIRLKLVKESPMVDIVLPSVTKPELNPLMDNQIKEFLVAAEKDMFHNIWSIMPFCGFRIGEVSGLTWDCISWQKGTIRIYQQLQKRPRAEGGLVFAPLKNSKPRMIMPAPFVMEILRKQYEEQATQRLAAGENWNSWKTEAERKKALVFTMPNGDPINPATLWRHFKAVTAEIGVDCRVHDLRHTYAILSLENGDDALTVSNNLGHATPSFTLSVYGHVSNTMRNQSAANMQRYIDTLKCS